MKIFMTYDSIGYDSSYISDSQEFYYYYYIKGTWIADLSTVSR